ncbi:YcnI family protein [Roseomonas sp. SSH11]|uniref:YcnI family protein n=1 Tax=Pararoseomonas baculiformis TaxID=2820812 RepID=A0ABS4AG91_9PROT|nr:YcnI family protein [Pararoseomonas baculiformis]MBP0445538.1 YcnI family protein [Pararoseomonas baculiformis]
MTLRSITAALALAAGLAAPAAAHVVLDQAEAPAGSYVRLAIRVGHGCGGAATTALRITVPPELQGARPMPHPGWTVSAGGAEERAGHGSHAGHAAHHGGHHAAASPGEIAWTGGRLDDAFFDEFVLLVRTPAEAGGVLAFPVVQECEGGKVARWVERAANPGERVAYPVPLLRVVPKR